MAVSKLSQIAPSGAAPAATDQLVGVQTGNTDLLYTLTQIGSGLSTGGLVFPPMADRTIDYQSVAVGFAYTIPAADWHLVLIGTTPLISGTLTMPAAPRDGEVVNIRSTGSIAPLFVLPNVGQTITDPPNEVGPGGGFEAVFRSSTSTWFCQVAAVAPLAGGNLDFFVATTGSDSNPGTVGLPFATTQHALNVAAEFDYSGGFTASIHHADGVYPATGNNIQAPAFINVGGANGVLILGNSATPANVDLSAIGTIVNTVPTNFFSIDGITIKELFWQAGKLLYGNLRWAADGASTLFHVVGNATVDESTGPTITVSGTVGFGFIIAHSYAFVIVDNSHIVFPATFSFNNAFADVKDFSFLNFINAAAIVNAGGVTGFGLALIKQSGAVSFNGFQSDFPGFASGFQIDNSCTFGFGDNSSFPAIVPQTGVPTLPAFPIPNTYKMTTDTVGGRTYFAIIDNPGTGIQIMEVPTSARVSSQFDKTNTTLADVSGLTTKVAAGRTYCFRAYLHVSPDAVGGHKYAIAGTCTATAIIYQVNSVNNTSNANILNSRQTALGGAAGVVSGTVDYTEIVGTITVNAGGTLTAQFAQQVASGTSSVLVGSFMDVRDIT